MRLRRNPDLESVRSVPILSVIRKKATQSPSRQSINSPSEFDLRLRSLASSKGFQPYWKDIIHPEVLEKYEQLRQSGVEYESKKRSRVEESPIRKYNNGSRMRRDSVSKTHLM